MPSALSQDILDSLAILERGSDSGRAVLDVEENRFSRALDDLKRLADGERIPLAIVGGLGAIRYGYPAATQDIDIAVGRTDLERILCVAPRYGFIVAWEAKSLTHGDVEINIVPEGGKARNNAPTLIPGPSLLGVANGLGYASLPGWMELKLSSGRQKDRAHIVEVLKKTPASAIDSARLSLAIVHEDYVRLFDELRQQATDELEQERHDERDAE